jgi:Retrotransposon gag protein
MWEQLKEQLTSYYRPLHQELRARDALHLLRQRGSVDDYAKSFNNLILKVPGMTLEEKLYIFIKGLKTNIQISVAMQDPTTVEQAKILAASADGILSQQRRSPLRSFCQSWFAFHCPPRAYGDRRNISTPQSSGPR